MLARPTPRQSERAPQPAQSKDENYLYARVRSEVGLQARQRGEAMMWRRYLVFPRRTPTNERLETLPTQVGVMVGVVLYRTWRFYRTSCKIFARRSKNSFARSTIFRDRELGDQQIVDREMIGIARGVFACRLVSALPTARTGRSDRRRLRDCRVWAAITPPLHITIK